MREAPVVEDPGKDLATTRTGGPPRFFALFTRGELVLIGTCGRGIARSHDGGRSFTKVGQLLDDSDVNAIVDGPDGSILAAAGTAGVLRSDDRGVTWQSLGPEGADVFCVRPDGDGLLAGARDGLHEQRDGTWRRVTDGRSTSVYRLASPAEHENSSEAGPRASSLVRGGAVVAATDAEGVWRRGEGGPWQQVGVGDWPVFSLVDAGGGEMLAGTRGGGVFRSTDDGATWLAIDWPFDPIVHVLVRAADGGVLAGTGCGVLHRPAGSDEWLQFGDDLDAHRIFSLRVDDGGRVLAGSYEGVWSRTDGGDRWLPVDTGMSAGETFAVAALGRGIAYAGGPGAAMRSADSGLTWQPASAGLEGVTTLSLTLAAVRQLYAGTDDGLRVLDLASGRWLRSGLDGIRVYRVFEVAPGTLLAGTLGRGAFRRTEDGEWTAVDVGPGHAMVYDFVRSRSGDIYGATGNLVGGAKHGGVSRSTDEGLTWTVCELDPISVYKIVESSSGTLFAGAQRSCILRSFDAGATWEASRPSGYDDSKTYCLVVDHDDRLYFGTGARLLCSDDLGGSWREIGRGLDGVTVYAVLSLQPDSAMLAATSSGVYRSTDRGVSWRARSQ